MQTRCRSLSWLSLTNFIVHFRIMFGVCPLLFVRDNLQKKRLRCVKSPSRHGHTLRSVGCSTIKTPRPSVSGWHARRCSWSLGGVQRSAIARCHFLYPRPSETALVGRETSGSTRELAVLTSQQSSTTIPEFVAIRLPRVELVLLRVCVLSM